MKKKKIIYWVFWMLFFVASAFTVATNIIGKRIDDEEDQEQS
jgi:hypothetical protein